MSDDTHRLELTPGAFDAPSGSGACQAGQPEDAVPARSRAASPASLPAGACAAASRCALWLLLCVVWTLLLAGTLWAGLALAGGAVRWVCAWMGREPAPLAHSAAMALAFAAWLLFWVWHTACTLNDPPGTAEDAT